MQSKSTNPYPKRIENLINHHGPLGVHITQLMEPWAPETMGDRIHDIMTQGLLPPKLVARLSKSHLRRLGIKFNKSPSSPGFVEAVVFGVHNKDQLAELRPPLPVFLFKPKSLPQGTAQRTPTYYSTSKRIKPDQIVAIFLSGLFKTRFRNRIEEFYRYRKPIYGQDGVLIWAPIGEVK